MNGSEKLYVPRPAGMSKSTLLKKFDSVCHLHSAEQR